MAVKEDLKRQAQYAAIKLATVATLATGPLQAAAAYQSETSVDGHQVELAETPVQNEENLPNLFSMEEVAETKETMQDDYEEYLRRFLELRQEDSSRSNKEAEKIYEILQKPMYYNEDDLSEEDGFSQEELDELQAANESFCIGNWRNMGCRNYEMRSKSHDMTLPAEERLRFQKKYAGLVKTITFLQTSREQNAPEKADELIAHRKLKIVNAEDDMKSLTSLAYFSPNTQDITLHKYLPHEQMMGNNHLAEYSRGNPVAQTTTLIHENVHENHWSFDGLGKIQLSPVNGAKSDRLTETVANAAEYLYAAHQYTLFKEQGMENLSVKRDDSLEYLMLSYNKLDKETRPEFDVYLKDADIETMHFSEKKDLQGILMDYKSNPEENKELLSDYLQTHGIQTLQVVQSKSLNEVLSEYVNWKDKGERPAFDAYIEELSEKGVKVVCEGDSYSLSNCFSIAPEIGVAVENGEDYTQFLEAYGFDKGYEVQTTMVKTVEELKDTLNQPEKSINEILADNKLAKDAQYRIVCDKSVDEIVHAWNDMEKCITKEDDIWKQLADRGLAESYITRFEEMPIERVLEGYEGLKEVVSEHGFDVENSESVRRVVEASSKYWHKDCADAYREQMLNCALAGDVLLSCKSLSEQKEILENEEAMYQRVSGNMLKDVYIGHNTTVDLSMCRDLLDTLSTDNALKEIDEHNQALVQSSEQEKEICENKIRVVSLQEIQEIDAYLTSKGLKNDDEKMAYMAKHLDDVAYRRGKNEDKELTAIMLKHNSEITYQDGLNVEYRRDGSVWAKADGKTYDLTSLIAANDTQKENSEQQLVQTCATKIMANRER